MTDAEHANAVEAARYKLQQAMNAASSVGLLVVVKTERGEPVAVGVNRVDLSVTLARPALPTEYGGGD